MITSQSSMTVAELLSLKELASCKVVAGINGLSRTVRWVHTSDLPDASYWLRGGELLIHSGARKELNLVHLIRQLHSVGASAVAIAEASDVVSNESRRTADELEVPLILIPDEIRFVDLTYAISHALIDREVRLSLEIEDFWRETTQTIVYDLESTLQYVSDWLSCSVTLFDKFHAQIVFKTPASKQQKWQVPFVPEERFSQALASSDGVYVSNGLNLQWVAVVRYRSSILSFVVLDFGSQTRDEVSSRQGIPAIQLSRIAVTLSLQTQDLRLQVSGDVLRSIMDEELSNKELEDKCREVGIDLKRPGRIILFRATHKTINFSLRHVEHVTRNFTLERIIARFIHDTLLVWTPNVTKSDREQHRLLVDRLRQVLSSSTGIEEWMVGVGGEFAGIEGIRKSNRQADIALRRCPPSAIFYFEDVSVWDVLMNQMASTVSQETIENYVLPINPKERVRLTETINALIETNFNVSKAAEVLALHRNGLNRRLYRWREKLGVDFTRPQNVLAFSAILSLTATDLLQNSKL